MTQSATYDCLSVIDTQSCVLRVPMYASSLSTLTYCATWYIGSIVDDALNCTTVTQQTGPQSKLLTLLYIK